MSGMDSENEVSKSYSPDQQVKSGAAYLSGPDMPTTSTSSGYAEEASDSVSTCVIDKEGLSSPEIQDVDVASMHKQKSDDSFSELDDEIQLHWDEDDEKVPNSNVQPTNSLADTEPLKPTEIQVGKTQPDADRSVSDENPKKLEDETLNVTQSSACLSPKVELDNNKSNTLVDVKKDTAEDAVNISSDVAMCNTSICETDEHNERLPSMSLDSSVYPDIQHGLRKPDQMIEIPTQELIEIDESILNTSSQSIESVLDSSNTNVGVPGNFLNEKPSDADVQAVKSSKNDTATENTMKVAQMEQVLDNLKSQDVIKIEESDEDKVKDTDIAVTNSKTIEKNNTELNKPPEPNEIETQDEFNTVSLETLSQPSPIENIVKADEIVTLSNVEQQNKDVEEANIDDVMLPVDKIQTTISETSKDLVDTELNPVEDKDPTTTIDQTIEKFKATLVGDQQKDGQMSIDEPTWESITSTSLTHSIIEPDEMQLISNTNQPESNSMAPSTDLADKSQLSDNTIVKQAEDETVSSTATTDQLKPEPESKASDSALVDQSEGLEADTSKATVDQSESKPTEAPIDDQSTAADQLDDSEAMAMEDSLGLLAESSRVMDDDEDEEENEADGDGDGDEDDDYEPEDESSNQMTTADHSEDSNAQQSETDPIINQIVEKDTPSPSDGKEFDYPASDGVDADTNKDVVVDEIECEEMEVPSPPCDEDQKKLEDNSEITENVHDKTTEPEIAEDVTANSINESNAIQEQKTDSEVATDQEPKATSPSKSMHLSICKPKTITFNYVDLEESSSEDDVQLIKQQSDSDTAISDEVTAVSDEVTAVNLPKGIEVMAAAVGATSDIVTRDNEVVITGVPKQQTCTKVPKLNTSEVTIKTVSSSADQSTLVIPEATISDVIEANLPAEEKKKAKLSLEIFSLDSDEEDAKEAAPPPRAPSPAAARRCAAPACRRAVTSRATSRAALHYYRRDAATNVYFCDECNAKVHQRDARLVEGIRSFMPLLDLDMDICDQELVEISDSESDDEGCQESDEKEVVGNEAAAFLEEHLADVLNETWTRFELDTRLDDAQNEIHVDLEKLDKEAAELNSMLEECQVATDKLRDELYATFEPRREELPGIVIVDTPSTPMAIFSSKAEERHAAAKKRRLSESENSTNKRTAIPLGFTGDDDQMSFDKTEDGKVDDDSQEDVSVVKLCAEVAPASLPPAGPLLRPPIKAGMNVYAMRNAFGSWSKAKILDILGKAPPPNQQFTQVRVKFESKIKNPCKVILARNLAYEEPTNVRLTIGTRMIGLFKDSENPIAKYYSGVVAEIPNPVNGYRYLVFFDDGYAQYVQHQNTRLVVESSASVWEEVHPFSREFVRQYLCQYPERPMVRLHAGQRLKTEWNGKWWVSRVVRVDASLVHVQFSQDARTEWIYRGSTRLAPLYLELQAAERTRNRPLPRTKGQSHGNVPYVEYTRSDEQNKSAEAQQQEEIRQRSVAKKSTSSQQVPVPVQNTNSGVNANAITSRVVYYTPKNAVKPLKMVPHVCGPRCKRADVLSLQDLRTYNPLAKPLLSGWERQIVRLRGLKAVMYRAPCGRRVRDMPELHRYLRVTGSEMSVDLFDFNAATHCLAEFVLTKCLVGKKDLSHGRENVPVPCVNYYDSSLPEFCSYSTERTPTAGVPLNLDPAFLCGCDCSDDCQDKSKCACWKMTLEGARTIGLGSNVGYEYRRLPEPLPSGIYECNSRCKCKKTCLNRVVQHPLQLKLQVFKTLNRGWGIRSLNDVPKGSFLCIYAGNLLTDATANLDGLNEGDEYLAELDYIEVVEQMKEGYEDDVPDADKKLDKKESKTGSDVTSSEESMTSSDEEQAEDKRDDDDFRPAIHESLIITDSNRNRERRTRRKRLDKAEREMEAKKEKEDKKEKEAKKERGDEDCITISDDEEVREPSRFTAQAGMDSNKFESKYRSVRSYFGRDEACYIMDAKVQGNIGRYLNHSCSPNVFVQNVFVDTHDPRFPWVAFFASSAIRAGSELTWNYNYDVGSVPGKLLYCYCGAPNCRGRLL